jgi:cytochrome c2
LSEHVSFPKVGGAVTAWKDDILVLDRLGDLYSVSKDQEVRKLSFPPLPNDISSYVRSGGRLDSSMFRAHDLKVVADGSMLVVSHDSFDPTTGLVRMTVSAIGVDKDSLTPTGQWEPLYYGDWARKGPTNASGGKLAVLNEDELLLSVGVYDHQMKTRSTNEASSLGTIVAIRLSTREARIFSRGHRNPQGLTVTTQGSVLSTEQGPVGGDELNEIREGHDYGWPFATLGTDYFTYGWRHEGVVGTHAKFVMPLFAWVPSIAPAGLIQVEGFDERWNGDLLAGSLKGLSVFRLRRDRGRILYSEQIWIGQRIRDIAQTDDGRIVLWTDDSRLLFLSVDKERLEHNRRMPVVSEALESKCMYCHHFGPTSPAHTAPSLSSLFGRRIAADNFRYSAALQAKDGAWTEAELRRFLTNTEAFASGTIMPPQHLAPHEIEEIVAALKDISALGEARAR